VTALGPGMGTTGTPASWAAATSSPPGSLTPGAPASVIRTRSRPPCTMASSWAIRPGSECAWYDTSSSGWASIALRSRRECRVSSAATTGAPRSTSKARAERSLRFPSGVARTKRVPTGITKENPGQPSPAEGRAVRGRGPADGCGSGGEVLLDLLLERRPGHRPDQRIDMLAVLEEEHRRDRPDVELHRALLVRIDIQLGDLRPPGVV